MVSLDTRMTEIPRVHKKILPSLKRLGIITVRDLLFYFPSRYQDFSDVTPIDSLTAGASATVQGIVKKINSYRTKRGMTVTEAIINDESGSIRATWFNQPFLARTIKVGQEVDLAGKVALGQKGLYLQSPAHERSGRELHTGRLVPIYPETYGISSRWLRFLIHTFLPLRAQCRDPLPESTRTHQDLPEIRAALEMLHFPESEEDVRLAKRRFHFEKLFLLHIRALQERARLAQTRAPTIPFDVGLIKKFVTSLPFPLTDAQRRSIWEIGKDIEKSHPMNRLLEGDVGSGKTIVAASAALLAAQAGYRVAYMAPTEILAKQHYATFQKLLTPFVVSIGLMTGSRKHISHQPDITIGTHALIQKNVHIENLGLVILDEQHRFGVEQRAALLKKQTLIPHLLSMTATPIPRTLALTIYSDLDLSLLDEMPKSRKKIITKIISPTERNDAYRFMREEIKNGRQAFVICPLIETPETRTAGSDTIGQQKLLLADVKTVKEEHRKLSEEIFPDLRVGMLHGKMKPKEKEEVMKKMRNNTLQILVATSVIEVGIDVPNATIMMIEGAERFGLAQLHQFRGRVGRASHQSYCLLFPTEQGMGYARLNALLEAHNGFALAEKDLALRGAGDLLGTQQWGFSDEMREALHDGALIRAVRAEAKTLLTADPTLSTHSDLRTQLAIMQKNIHRE